MTIPFLNAVCIDFEYRADPGERPHVWCLVAKDLHSGVSRRWWRSELIEMAEPPFDTGGDTVVCSYAVSAEMSCFLQLGWKPPEYLLDLYAEFRWTTNGRELRFGGPEKSKLEKHKNSMLAAAFVLGVPAMADAHKEQMRDLAITHWTFTDAERDELMTYCASDVEVTEQILLRLSPALDWPRALIRGRYGLANARMEHVGIPIDTPRWNCLQERWPEISGQLIESVDAAYGVYVDKSFSDRRFLDYVTGQGIKWPLTPTGRPTRDKDTLKEMARLHPQLNDLKELLTTLNQGRLLDLAIGRDGCNRTGLIPYRAVTGRNQPSSGKFIFGPACWIRGFIQAKPDEAVAYLDWAAEEIGIAAALSDDGALMADYQTGDPYIAFAIRAGLAPAGSTKNTHRQIRDLCKVLFLSLNYGRGAAGLAGALDINLAGAEILLRRHEAAYPDLYRWLRGVVDTASLTRWQHSPFGWRRYIPSHFNARSIRNWPCQSAGSELMWLSAIAMTESGIRVCAPVHDAFMIVAESRDIVEHATQATAMMEDFSETVTGGFRIRAEFKEYASPERYMDARGSEMWARVMGLLRYDQGEGRAGDPCVLCPPPVRPVPTPVGESTHPVAHSQSSCTSS